MKSKLSKTEVQQKIEKFFKRENFSSEEARKIKRLAMNFNIRLKNYRKKFCKKCYAKLKGRTRITKTHKTIECENCGYKNKFKL